MRVIENTVIGNVDAPGPDVKLANTTSSSDKVKASNHPETRPGANRGKVTRVNTAKGGA